MTTPAYAVIGGGIAGLAAAWELSGGDGRSPLRDVVRGACSVAKESRGPARIAVVEASDRLGGKIASCDFGGQDLEAGPDAFLARVPAGVDLCASLGLMPELISPATGKAYLWSRGRLWPMPANFVLGVPASPWSLARAGSLSLRGRLRGELDLVLGRTRIGSDDPDRSVGDVVRARFGRELTDTVVGPLVGGIHAGDIDRLSLAATAPVIDTASRANRSLMWALRAHTRPPPGPVFLAPRTGLSRLVDRLVEALAERGVEFHTASPVRSLSRAGGRWVLGITGRPEPLLADGVVLSSPAPVTARLIGPHAPVAASRLSSIAYSSVCLVTMSWPLDALARELDGSGFLVPAGEGRLMTACTWTSTKWPHLATPGRATMRLSAGRFGDDRALEMSDEDLVGALKAELVQAGVLRSGATAPSAHLVTRWPDSFPQYEVGHLDRIREVEDQMAQVPGLAVAGAALRGVGIPACIDTGRRAGQLLVGYCSSLEVGSGP
ncbi:MAG: protoporphyrinogen oxidase [Acidimicrobiales bacterium]